MKKTRGGRRRDGLLGAVGVPRRWRLAAGAAGLLRLVFSGLFLQLHLQSRFLSHV